MTRVYIHIGNERMELEDYSYTQFMPENTMVKLGDNNYRVASIKRILIKSGNSLDSQLDIFLE